MNRFNRAVYAIDALYATPHIIIKKLYAMTCDGDSPDIFTQQFDYTTVDSNKIQVGTFVVTFKSNSLVYDDIVAISSNYKELGHRLVDVE